MDPGIEARAGRQGIVRKKMLAGPEDARAAVLKPDLHLPREDEDPLSVRRAMPLAAESERAVAKLIARGGKERGEHRLRVSLGEPDRFFAKSGPSVGAGEEDHFPKGLHDM